MESFNLGEKLGCYYGFYKDDGFHHRDAEVTEKGLIQVKRAVAMKAMVRTMTVIPEITSTT